MLVSTAYSTVLALKGDREAGAPCATHDCPRPRMLVSTAYFPALALKGDRGAGAPCATHDCPRSRMLVSTAYFPALALKGDRGAGQQERRVSEQCACSGLAISGKRAHAS
jgi:hypothetical protein